MNSFISSSLGSSIMYFCTKIFGSNPAVAYLTNVSPFSVRYYNTMLGHYGAAPAVATPELCEEVVRKHLQSNSILAILSLQDWMSMDGKWRNPNAQEERINVPANPRHYWRWRMHLTLEQLMKAESLNEKIKELIAQTGR